ncbi:vitamin-D-receptor interacting mediator subunit 4-domain-containing protein [Phellopilus nigrolimitatus]|nr:vitamin-D-receptor interacting mediator subunit 4-domain-containing protein [Phellopilus nigrolimitatus]
MTDTLLAPLDALQQLSNTLFLSLSPAQTKPPPPPPIEAFVLADTALAAALQQARVHQLNQRRIEALSADVLGLEKRLREVWTELERGRKELEEVIQEGEERVEAIKKAKDAALPYPELLTYAQSLSAFSSAPPNMPDMSAPGQLPPPLFFPPFPNEEKMRRGRLNFEAPLGLLGESHPVGRPPTLSPEKPELNAPLPMHGAFPYRLDSLPNQEVFDLDLDLNPDF